MIHHPPSAERHLRAYENRNRKDQKEARQIAFDCVANARASRKSGDHAACVRWLNRARKYRTWVKPFHPYNQQEEGRLRRMDIYTLR